MATVGALAVLGAAALGAAAGGGGSPSAPAAAEDARASAPALTRFASCERLLSHVRRRALARTGPWGLDGVAPAVALAPGAEGVRDGAAPTRAAAPAPVSGIDFSGTNVQEAGVDEPDLVETDGRTLFVLAGGRLQAVDVSAGAPRRIGGHPLTGMVATGMLLMGDRLVVLGHSGAGGGAPGPLADLSGRAWYGPPPAVVALSLDVADPARPREVARLRAEGGLVTARAAGGTVRLVLAGTAPHLRQTSPAAEGSRARSAALRANRAAVRRAPAAAWLPRLSVRDAATGRTTRRGVPCRAVSRPTVDAGVGTVTVLTVRATEGLEVTDTDTVLTDGGIVSASASSLYVATPRWSAPGDGAPPRGATQIHRLDVSDPRTTEHRASGVVAGYPLNQFSLSEHEGHLRVATTEEPAWWAPPDGTEAAPGESRVTVLAESGGRLVRTGEVRGLGRGERIHAVRFLGDRGYVVTFRQVDPLYVLDLADPAAPALRGELKIPGFSSYLHPIDAGTLIGIGQDADAGGRVRGTQVSLFDVSDPARPARLAQRTLDAGWSEAESDHLAFLWWPAARLLVVPVQGWGAGTAAPFLGAVGLHVDRATGITPIARVRHPGDPGDAWAPVRRAVVAGGALHTVSDAGVLTSDPATLAPRGWLAFP
jgi:hypothetical protein